MFIPAFFQVLSTGYFHFSSLSFSPSSPSLASHTKDPATEKYWDAKGHTNDPATTEMLTTKDPATGTKDPATEKLRRDPAKSSTGREYDASETLQGRGYRPATTIEDAHTHLAQADQPASRKKVRKEPGGLGQQHQKHLSASYPRASPSSRAGRADCVALDLVDTALLRTATPPAILPRQNNVRAAKVNAAEGRALDYAIEVESRLRSELLEAREALSMERARTSALSKRLRELSAGHARGGARPHTTAVRRRRAGVGLGEAAGEGVDGGGEGDAPDDEDDDGLTSVASKV